jgi:hypothetical protein
MPYGMCGLPGSRRDAVGDFVKYRAPDIVGEVRGLVDAACKDTNIHRWSKFDRTLVIPLLEEAERMRAELEEFHRLMAPVSEDPFITEKTSVTEVRLRQLVEGLRREVENLKGGKGNGVRVDAR